MAGDREHIEKSLYFLLSFTVNLNVLLKSSLSKIKNFVENTYEKTNSVQGEKYIDFHPGIFKKNFNLS